MNHAQNPYQSPPLHQESWRLSATTRREKDWLAFLTWPIALALNLIVPTLFGLGVVSGWAVVGMGVACVLMLSVGWALCLFQPVLARRLTIGALAFAATQFLPVLQLVAGLIAIEIARVLGIHSVELDTSMPVHSTFLGGFLLTWLTGLPLATCALILGYIASLLLPKSWFQTGQGGTP